MIEDVTPSIVTGAKTLDSYGPGRFTVSGKLIKGSIILSAQSLIKWDVNNFSELTIDSFNEFLILDENIEVLLFGCGEKTQLVPHDIRDHIKQAGITLDFMTTGAAARTYNIMLSEGRQVAAALIALNHDTV